MTPEERRIQAEERKKREIALINVKDTLTKVFKEGSDLMNWLEQTTGWNMPFPEDPVKHNRAEGQRELVITIKNMVKMSPNEVIKKLL